MLSVVVADVTSDRGAARQCADALERELTDDDEVIWLGRRDPCPSPRARLVQTPRNSRGSLYAAGLDEVSRPFVAFTDAVTQPLVGWRDAAVSALVAGASVVGGPVLPRLRSTVASSGGFLVEYGPHAVPPFTSATGDVAANNVAYDLDALRGVLEAGEGVWKTVVDRRLAAQRRTPVVVPGMRVRSLKRYGWRDLVPDRAAHGRLYAAQQAEDWPPGRRVLRAAGSVFVPVVSFLRLARVIGSDRALRRRLAVSSPVVVVALTAWAAGEAGGFLGMRPSTEDVF